MNCARRSARGFLCLLLIWCAACADQGTARTGEGRVEGARSAAQEDSAGESAIVLDSAAQQAIGLRTAPLTRSREVAQREFPAEVIQDPGATIAVRTGLAGRLSVADGRRWPRIGEALEAGTAIAVVGDGVPVTVPRGGTVSAVLAQPGELVQAGQPLLSLSDFSAVLIQVSAPGELGLPPGRLQFGPLSGAGRFFALRTGPADAADPLSRAPAWYYRAEGSPLLRPGVGLIAYLPDPAAPTDGLLVPSAAVVQWDALAWAFVERSPGHFVRVRVPTDYPVQDGWLVTQGFHPGDRVVTRAAGQLLSEEFRARIVVGEEVGE